MKSAVYLGRVRHRRFEPVENAFEYDVCYFYLDLAEAPWFFRTPGLFGYDRPGLFAFRRSDYFGDPAVPLADAVRDRVEKETGRRPEGPVRLLTQIRYFGYGFNPVSFYYCFDPSGERVEAILAEITNTPWNERHAYVLRCGGDGAPETFEFDKAFHVSPFMDMAQRYRWRFGAPGEELYVHMDNLNRDGGERLFDATLRLRRRPLTAGAVAAALALHPFMTLKTIAAIHWQAFKLWAKRAPFYPHPAGENP